MKTNSLLIFSLFCKAASLVAQIDQAAVSSNDEIVADSINSSEEIYNESKNRQGESEAAEEYTEKSSSPLMMFGWGFDGYGEQTRRLGSSYAGSGRGRYDDDDDDPPRRNMSSSASVQRSSSMAGEAEQDFTQRVLNWRLGSIHQQLEDASSATPLSLSYDSRATYYNQFLPLILEEARAAIEKGFSERNRSFSVRIKNDVREPVTRGNPWIMNLEGAIPSDQEHAAVMNVLLLEHKSGMKFLVLANEKGDENELKAKFELSPATVATKRSIFNAGSQWNATYVTSLVTHERAYEACLKKTQPECLKRIVLARIHVPIEAHDPRVEERIQDLNESQRRAIQSVVAARDHSISVIQGPPGTGKTTTVVGLLGVLCDQNQRALVCAPSNKAVQVVAERFLKDYPDIPIILAGVESKISDELRPIFLHTWQKDLRKTFLKNLDAVFLELNPPDSNPTDLKAASNQKQRARSIKFHKDRLLDLLEKAKEDMIAVESQLKKYRFECEADFYSSTGASTRKSLFEHMRKKLEWLTAEVGVFNFAQENALTLFKEHVTEQRVKLTKVKDGALRLPVFKDDSDTIERKLIAQSKVVCATLSVTGRRSIRELPSGVLPNILVVDEAGQSVEAETLIPFQHNPIKVVLAGDTKQLPATTMSQLAKEKNYDRSMMGRLEQNNQPALMLETQYRMDPEICHWPSRQYYDGRLQTHSSIVPNVDSGVTQAKAFYDIVSGKESSSGNSMSKQNEKEADYVLQIIRKIREKDKTSSIGVISFYGAQVEAIQKMLKQGETRGLQENITVSTVDGFQGGERDIILVSCVRAKEKAGSKSRNQIGFLNDERRLNVAITRAKRTLIVLGHARTLESQESDVKNLITDLRGRKKFFTEQQLNQFLENEIGSVKTAAKKAKAISASTAAILAIAAVDVAAPKAKQKQGAGKKGKQIQMVPTEMASKLARINDPKAYYSDDDMSNLGEMLLPANVHYVVPAVAAVPAMLSQAMDAFISNPEKQQAVIAIHNENHFTGVLISKKPSNQFSITHFDPVAFDENGRPLHKIPDTAFRVLREKFPGVSINNTNSKMQTYTTQGSAKEKVNVMDNNQCGPFVLYVMTEMAKENLRLNPSKPRKLQLKVSEGGWIEIPPLDQSMSDNFGKSIRGYHAAVLSGDADLAANAQIAILRNLITQPQSSSSSSSSVTPLEAMSALKSALPIPPPKLPKPPKPPKKSQSTK
ncbi:MAG: AAA family ATPase [Chthoniobacterales bacterium]|nr:AAA family ATPase [Chthoniobacterales bacterium]